MSMARAVRVGSGCEVAADASAKRTLASIHVLPAMTRLRSRVRRIRRSVQIRASRLRTFVSSPLAIASTTAAGNALWQRQQQRSSMQQQGGMQFKLS